MILWQVGTPLRALPRHCERSIQPHGVLLVAEGHSQRILQVAGETERMLGRSIGTILNHSLGEVLGPQAAALVASAQAASEPVYLGSVAISGAELSLTAHDREDIRILEIEPSSPLPQSTAEVMAQARRTAGLFARARTQSCWRAPRARLAASRASTAL